MATTEDLTRRLEAIRRTFPGAKNLQITSDRSVTYNCIAWVMDDTARVWWPLGAVDFYWPPVPPEVARRSFEWAFGTRGYTPCPDGSLQPGIEKVALYEKNKVPTHAARQLPTGRWTSKLGIDEDVEHDLADLVGRRYGQVAAFYQRERPPPT
jgi:hypothetical protein